MVLPLELTDPTVTAGHEGTSTRGSPVRLIDGDDDLTAGTPWADDGYTVAPFLPQPLWAPFRSAMIDHLAELLGRHGVTVDPSTFEPGRYHELVPSDEVHLAIARAGSVGVPPDDLPIPREEIEARISELLGVDVWARHNNNLCVRFVRPGRRDNNPLHRDVWLDRLRHAINLYIPLVGSTARSSLPIVPGSHRWPESDLEISDGGATIEGATFSVPSVTGAVRRVEVRRPTPGPNEVMVFSPYLLHGGASNGNPETTRVSVELRLWRR